MLSISNTRIAPKGVESYIRATWIHITIILCTTCTWVNEWHQILIGTNINQVQAEFRMKYLKLEIIEPIFKRVTICLIFISQWAAKARVIAKFTVPAILNVRIRIFLPYVSPKPKTKVGPFFWNTLYFKSFILQTKIYLRVSRSWDIEIPYVTPFITTTALSNDSNRGLRI